VCLIFCEPQQQDVVDLLCSLATLSKDAPVNLAAMALSRLQPSQKLSVPLSLPTWHIEEQYTAIVPVSVQLEEDVKPVPVSGVPTSVILKPYEEAIIKLDVENILFGHSKSTGSSDPGGEDICSVTLGQDKITKVTNGRQKILKRKGASQWGGKKAAPSGRKKACRDKTADKKERIKTSLDTSSIKTEVVEEDCANNSLDNPDPTSQRCANNSSENLDPTSQRCANNSLENPDPTSQRFANMKVPVPVPQQGFRFLIRQIKHGK
jgi:hypothetical protein